MKDRLYFTITAAWLTSLFMLGAPVQGMAQELKPNQVPTNLPGVFATAAPSSGFDPHTASDQELAYNGFPPRPDAIAAPEAFAKWQHAITGTRTRIIPKLRLTNIYHTPAEAAPAAPNVGSSGATALNYIWSGYVNMNGATSYTASSLYAVAGQYVVPVAQQAFGPRVCGDLVYAFTWVGIDGHTAPGDKEVLQAGTQSQTTCSNGRTGAFYSAWYEWAPFPETLITNLPTAPGDDYYVEVWNTSSTVGHAFLLNRTANLEVSITFSAPPGYSLVGNSFEWIMERPQFNGVRATLANYVSEPFTEAIAWNYSSNTSIVFPSSASSIALTMVDDNLVPISYPTLLGREAFVLQDEGRALGSSLPVP